MSLDILKILLMLLCVENYDKQSRKDSSHLTILRFFQLQQNSYDHYLKIIIFCINIVILLST